MKLSIIIPCKNEAENIPLIYERIKKAMHGRAEYEMLFVEYNSSDNSREIIKDLEKKDGRVVYVKQEGKPGISRGWWAGFKAARGEFLLVTDCDMQYRPEDIPMLFDELEKGRADMVQGFRFNVNFPMSRFFLSVGMSCLFNVLFFIPLKDVKSGFFVCRKEVFGDIMKYNDDYFYYQHLFSIVARRKGYKIRQVPTLFEERAHGKSYIGGGIPLKFIVRAFKDIAIFTAEYYFTRKFSRRG